MNRDIEARLKISAIDKTGKVLANIGRKLETVNAKATAFSRMNNAIGDQLGLLGRYVGPAALGLEFYRATKAAADFESTLFNIQKKGGYTDQQMQQIGMQIRQLSHDMPVARDEIAAAVERGAAAGIPEQDLKEFARLSAMIADGWEVTGEEAGNAIAVLNKGLHIPMQDMEKFASLINDLADSGISDEKDIQDFIQRVGPSLQNFGLTPNEIAAYGAAMLNLKMPAEVAARAMDTLTGKLFAPENLSKKSRNALASIVGDLKSFSKLSGSEKLNRFMGSLQKMTNQRKASLLGALLGEGFDDEIMRLVTAYDELNRNRDIALRQVANPSHSITALYEKQLQTFNKQLQLMKNDLGDIEVSLGNRILPTANKVVHALADSVKTLDDIDAGNRISAENSGKTIEDDRRDFKQRLIDDDVPGYAVLIGRAHRAVAKDPKRYPTIDKWLDEYERQTIYGGNLSGGPRRRYSRNSTWNMLGADKPKFSVDNPPMPERRPTPQEMRDYNLQAALALAGQPDRAARTAEAKAVATAPAMARIAAMQADQDRLEHMRRDLDRASGRRDQFAAIPKGQTVSLDDTRRFLRDLDYAAGRTDQFAALPKTGPTEFQQTAGRKGGLLGALFYSPEQDKQASQAAQVLDEGSQKIKDGGDEAGKALIAAAQEAGRILQAAIAQASAALANIKVNVNAPVTATATPKANADLGKSNTFVRPATLGEDRR